METIWTMRIPIMRATMYPETRYALSSGVNIAYQVVGDGSFDLVLVPGWVSNVESGWEEPRHAAFLNRLASFSRLILFDRRGTGLSDREGERPTLEQRMDDVRAVMDAVGSDRAALVGYRGGGPMCLLFAATYPDRTSALVLYGSYARRLWAPDYPWGPTLEEHQHFFDRIERAWGTDAHAELLAPSAAQDDHFRRWWASYQRRSASPGAAMAVARMNSEIDVRHLLPAIRVPTLILHRTDDPEIDAGGSRYMAKRIPRATYVELAGVDHLPWIGDAESVLNEIQAFLTGTRAVVEPDRVVLTILMTDIVDSTRLAAELGDRRWRAVLAEHDDAVRQELPRHRGVERNRTGDGFLATFDGPARAIRCASAIREAVQPLGITVRTGLHTGECELHGEEVSGIALHIGARVSARAGPNEILVSSTVKDLVAGSGIEFDDRGRHTLKGVPGVWRLYAVV
jgi:pimeloyl-ACP methyl ester carboxylesterase